MLYQIEQGPIEAKIIEQAMRSGQPLPRKIANAPELLEGLEFIYLAYADLNQSEGSIPWIRIVEYASFYDLDADELDELLYLLGKMDQARDEYYQKKAEQS